MGSEIDISIDQHFQAELPEPWLRRAVEAALGVALDGVEAYQVSLLVTGDETVQGLNRDYRGLDEVTDVLSFSATHPSLWEGESGPPYEDQNIWVDGQKPSFVYPPDEPTPLGEVVISLPQAQRQALERSEPLDREMALLIVHGVLHLAGHDHAEPAEETAMRAKEKAALKVIPRLEMP